MSDSLKRRQFLKLLGLGVVAVPAMRLSRINLLAPAFAAPKKVDPPAGMNPVSESDPVASAVGYKHDAKKVDPKRTPKRKEGSFCDNCAFYTKQNDGWGKCQIIPTGVVNAKGYCFSWQKKA